MDFASFGKFVLEVILAVIAGIATIVGWVTKRFKEEREYTEDRFTKIEARLNRIEEDGNARHKEMEDIHRDLVEVKATLKAMPKHSEVAAIDSKLEGLVSAVAAIGKEVARTTEYLMNKDTSK